MNPKLLILLFLFLFTAPNIVVANSYQYVGNPISQVFNIEDHKSSNQIWSVNQYIDGRMLFATGNGVSTWDGENWQQFSTPNNTRIRDITVWQDNNIYAGATGELGYFSPTISGQFRFTPIPTDHLVEDFGQTRGVNSNNNIVVFSTDQSVLVWDGIQIQKVRQFSSSGSGVFKIADKLLVNDKEKLYSIEMVNGEPFAKPLDWQLPKNIRIKSLLVNQLNQILMVTNMQGVFQLHNNTFVSVISPDQLPTNHLNSGIQGKDGFYYLSSTIDGLMIFNPSFELMRHYKQTDGLGMSTIYSIFQDQQQNIWLGGLPNISVFQPPHFRSEYTSDTGTLDFESIYHLDGHMFFSGTGFYQLTSPNGISHSPTFSQISDFNLVVLDLLARQDELFVGTESGVYIFDWTQSNTQKVISNPRLISTQNWVSEMAFSPDNQWLYATIGNHLSQFRQDNGKWIENRLFEDKSGTEYLAIEPLENGDHHVWFTTEQRELYRISQINNKIDIDSLLSFNNQSSPLGNEHLRPFIYQKRALIGTQNGVIEFHPETETKFKPVVDLPLPLRSQNKDIFKIEIDNEQRIWYHAASDTGVIYKDDTGSLTYNETLFKPYNHSGTRGLALFDHSIWFGVASGSIYRLALETINNIPKAMPLAIQYINSINNNSRLPISTVKHAFSVDNNSIRIGFALADYSSPTKTLYRTLLTGTNNQQWTKWSKEASKDFTALSGGNYSLFVEAQDAWGRVSSVQHDFAVAYPWYLSYWAKLIYLTLLLAIIAASIRVGQKLRNKALEQQNQNLELGIQQRTKVIREKVEQLKEQQILKDRFFSNVSHEFRTPLTLTIGPLETILKEYAEHLNVHTKNLAVTALNNAKTMLALVGQVLDINRLEVGKLSLRVSKHDMADLLRVNQQRFVPWAEQHQQKLTLLNCENPNEIYCDVDQVDKCISNLLSNAIKYSGKGSVIEMELIHHQDQLGIRIADNGHGIHSSHKERVFERYHQEELSNSESSAGTGIGLALVKELIDLHRGTIELETEIDQGCQFTLWLAYGKSHFESEQLVEPVTFDPDNAAENDSTDLFEKDYAKILVVDDNAELRQFICQRLTNSFTVIEADNGESGFMSALKNLPDIIISDITMPIMSGLELTKKIKDHPETKHIPILLLSAQTMKRDIVQGFACGADDYLIKPFDTSELVMRVNTLIKSRKSYARNKIHIALKLEGSLKNSDSFEDNIQRHNFAHLHQADFNIDILSQLLFMSKETLRRKCQASFEVSPSAYIQQTRLQQAKLLLEHDKMNVSEVAYAVGFDSLAYFSKVFKKYYGVNPSSFILKETRSKSDEDN
jgi:signal transduction histidine kinase/DNA-binding response OmpR family regulator/ligand-binding sensor domain-containing protein